MSHHGTFYIMRQVFAVFIFMVNQKDIPHSAIVVNYEIGSLNIYIYLTYNNFILDYLTFNLAKTFCVIWLYGLNLNIIIFSQNFHQHFRQPHKKILMFVAGEIDT